MTLLFFMDGLKFEQIKQHMPYLSSLYSMPMHSEFGYSCACHATMYTGRYIEEHNTWFVWKRGDNSPYKFIDKFPLIKLLNCIPVKIMVSKLARRLRRNSSFAGIPLMVNLPLKYWSLFETCEDAFWTDDEYMPKYATLFRILRECGINHQLVGLSKTGDVFTEGLKIHYDQNDFIYYFIGEVDSYLHLYGEESKKTHDYLSKVDAFIQQCCDEAEHANGPITAICFSDHGHVDVNLKIDINVYFKQRRLNVNRYIHLIESTFARFWPRNDQENVQIRQVLNDMQKNNLGFILKHEDYEHYHLKFTSIEHGDIIFHLQAPNIFTNTIWGFGKTIRSMHGYIPELEKHLGVFSSNLPLIVRDHANLIDLLPTLLPKLGIDTERYELHGVNLLASSEGDHKS